MVGGHPNVRICIKTDNNMKFENHHSRAIALNRKSIREFKCFIYSLVILHMNKIYFDHILPLWNFTPS